MCLILFACHIHPDYPLVLAANRDEFRARPTRAAQWWDDCPELLAGKDLSGGGTWLGVTRSGRMAAVTNFRDPASHNPAARSRGELTSEFLQQQIAPEEYRQKLQRRRDRYNGYNLLFGFLDQLHYFSNRDHAPLRLAPGVYGLSNHLLNTPWPKVRRGKAALALALEQRRLDFEHLWPILADPSPAADSELPATGISLEWERTLSAINIGGDHYGTRSSTLLLAGKDGVVRFAERSFVPDRQATEIRFSFTLRREG